MASSQFKVGIQIKATAQTRGAVTSAIRDLKRLQSELGRSAGRSIAAIRKASAAAVSAQFRAAAVVQGRAVSGARSRARRAGTVLGEDLLLVGAAGTFRGSSRRRRGRGAAAAGAAVAGGRARRRGARGSGDDIAAAAAAAVLLRRPRSAAAVDADVKRRLNERNRGKFSSGASSAPGRAAAVRTTLGVAGRTGTKIAGVAAIGASAGVAAGGVLATALIIKKMVSSASAFEDASVSLQITSRASKEQMEAFRAQSVGLARGGKSLFGAAEITKAQEFGALAGLSPEEILQATPVSLGVATATGTTAGFASDALTDIASAMGLGASEFGRLGDVMLRTTQISNTNFRQLSGAMKKFAPTASQLGFSIEQSAALLGTVADKGVKGATAGLAVSRVFARLVSGKSPVNKALKGLGLKLSDLTDNLGNLKDPTSVLETIGTALTKRFGPENRAAKSGALGQLFDVRGAKTFQQLFTSLAENKRKELQLLKAEGATADSVALKMNTLSGKIKILGSTFDSLMASAGEGGLLGAMKGIVDWVTGVIREDPLTKEEERIKILGGGASAKTKALLSARDDAETFANPKLFGLESLEHMLRPQFFQDFLEGRVSDRNTNLNASISADQAAINARESIDLNKSIDAAARARAVVGVSNRTGSETATRPEALKGSEEAIVLIQVETDTGKVTARKKKGGRNVRLEVGSQVEGL